MNNLSAALAYAEKMKWRVFPCGINKKPLMNDWPHRASNDPKQIKEWWTKNPTASIGLVCGEEAGVWVLDVDLKLDGPQSLAALQLEHGLLPVTLKQKTGSGGSQLFWKWNGTEIRNSASRFAKGLDVRGNGGYVILPPSGHPSGGTYEWITKVKPIESPTWLTDLAIKTKLKPYLGENKSPLSSTKYGEAALAKELIKLSMGEEGSRNQTLNDCAYALGQLVAGGELNRTHSETALYAAATSIGLESTETRETIRSGFEAGILIPRSNPHVEEELDLSMPDEDQMDQMDQMDHSDQKGSSRINLGSNEDHFGSNEDQPQIRPPYNLHSHIGDYIGNSGGCFTNRDLDIEFNLKTRTEKLQRSRSLYIYKEKEKRIRSDKTIRGKWWVIDNSIEWEDLTQADEAAFDIHLPFDLHEKVYVPKHSIIIIAGSSNAGKTCFILNTIKLNMNKSYDRVYLKSEMAGGELKDRLLSAGESVEYWQSKMRTASKSKDFDGTILNHNPHGLTCIDYLEEVDGEYAKIPSHITNIYDSLGDGVAVVAIQKRSRSEIAVGGEGTKDKCRLYIAMDLLCSMEHAVVCAIKIIKAKKSLHENMNDKEMHFRIERGLQTTVLLDWTPSYKVNRQKYIKEYQGGEDFSPYSFMTEDGYEVQLNARDYTAWGRKFTAFDLDAELKRISEYSYIKAWFNKKNWFFKLGGFLDKKQKGVDE